MSTTKDSPASINAWLEEELYQQYLNNVKTVDEEWRHVFEESGAPTSQPRPEAPSAPAPEPESKTTAVETAEKPITVGPGEQLVPLRGAAARLAENMNQSLRIPTATSQRVIPVKVIDENRIILNQHRTLLGKSKISYTHIVAWAIVKAIETLPNINSAYAESDGEPFRIVRPEVNLGVAVDLPGKDGARQLVVPNIKNVHSMNFLQFIDAYDDLVVRARSGKLQLADFQGTTLSLTNPGTIGTVGSVPRLMPGQGAIIATGAIDYPAEYQGTAPEMRAFLGLSKVMTVTCTYDHRVIQGAESGMFLARLHALIQGAENFYEQIFAALKIPYQPVKWNVDQRPALPGAVAAEGARSEVAKEAAVLQMINAYRVRGHLIADLDPLGGEPQYHPELDPASYGLSIWDLDRHFHPGNLGHFTGDAAPKGSLTLREILEVLRQTYCGKVGCEYMNIQIPEQKAWLQERMERPEFHAALAPEVKKRILERLVEAEMFENFLHTRFIGQKRFSMEGGETAIAILDEVLDCAANEGVHEAVMGMAHRGRLTVLANLIGKTLTQIFSEFEGAPDPDSVQGSGDVKYHLGAAGVRTSTKGKEIVVSVAPNPSHLEAVDPVVEGIVRPKQERLGDTKRERVIPILIHGDAAFAGQGVVAETLNLSQLEGYHTGGTVHLIINNQIGFTTNPQESRSTPYCTDVARMVQAPIFHVNGDHPESAFRVAKLAYDFRQQFKKDVVIDMLCYRKHGHNEGDDPSYTQPVVYRKIKDHVPVATQYAERLQREGVIDSLWLDALRKRVSLRLEEGFQSSKQNAEKFEFEEMAWLDEDELRPASFHTPISEEMAARVVRGITAFPEDFRLHPKLKGFIDKRREVLDGAPIDWAMGEALAFGSLVLEGTPVRLSGQDCSRGTFSQRHSAYFDYDTGREYVPLKNLSPEQARFEAVDSSLSEYAVMGFEFGYSVADPTTLVMWEAQFGDFVNGAQIMIDQFVSACEAKWGQPSGLVLLLPHGYEGQGPEHSSARIERFLQLCAENNMIVANCTTPAQYFHLLRRQMYGGRDRRGLRKPLILFTPKSILRHPKAVSRLSEITGGGFREVLGDVGSVAGDRVSRVLLCSGKIYYDLMAAREAKDIDHVAIVRIEQLYPFPMSDLQDKIMRYPSSAELLWVQEEPKNMGAWRFVQEKMSEWSEAHRRPLHYIGRPESASPSGGSAKRHAQEQNDIVEAAFSGEMMELRPRRIRVVPRRKR